MRGFSLIAFGLYLLSATCCESDAYPHSRTAQKSPGWTLTWSDEFSSANGSAPDPKKWTFDLGGDGWGNFELQSYTARTQNAQIQNGNLAITAQRETFTGADGIKRDYTSARLKTQAIFEQAYGRFEARIKIPKGQGMWPAFWMLGADVEKNPWPKCGEIDIMENIGSEPGINHASLHGPYPGRESSVTHNSDLTGTYVMPTGQILADDFHIYAIEWEPGIARFYVDSSNYATFTQSQWPAGGQWVFEHPFFIILNVAVGGAWPGKPDATTQFPQKMLVDYVRVYSKQ
jgi:beta-glucanase (GH16 family)